jgi:hypothetical protein
MAEQGRKVNEGIDKARQEQGEEGRDRGIKENLSFTHYLAWVAEKMLPYPQYSYSGVCT